MTVAAKDKEKEGLSVSSVSFSPFNLLESQ